MINPNRTEDILHSVPLQNIAINMWTPHQATSDELNNITLSIKEVGQLIPILLVEWDIPITWENTEYIPNKEYLLVDGHQRFTCLKELFKQGDNNALFAKAIVIGKVSDYAVWELAEFGQIANHARGSLEDATKTGQLLQELTKFRNVGDYVKITNQRADYVSKAMALIEAKKTNATKAIGVPAASGNRGYYTVSLPFEDAAEVQEFEAFLSQLPDSGKSYRGLDRSYRLLNLMKEHFDA